jgi:hypothetical protein
MSKGKGKTTRRYSPLDEMLTPAQKTMRKEMTEGKGKMTLDDVFDKPVTLGAVFDEMLGGPVEPSAALQRYATFNRSVPNIALSIIDGYDLVLSLKQWQQVQAMVEDGIREGYRTCSDGS